MNDVDLSLLDDEITIAVNNVLTIRHRLNITYHIIFARNRWLHLLPEVILTARGHECINLICAPPYDFLVSSIPLLWSYSHVCLVGRFKRSTPTELRNDCLSRYKSGVVSDFPPLARQRQWGWRAPHCTHLAIKLAEYLGAKEIGFLGQDGYTTAKGSHFSTAGIHNERYKERKLNSFCKFMERTAKRLAKGGVEAYNCSPGSAIDMPTKSLQEAIQGTAHAP